MLCELSKQSSNRDCSIGDIERALELIENTPSVLFTIQELSDFVHMHPRSFTKKFKNVISQTVHQYQLNLKLQMAYTKIEYYNDISFREVAEHYGFCDEFHFSKAFKNKYGFFPKALRTTVLSKK